MMLRAGELKYIMPNTVEVDMYNPRSGGGDKLVVVNFFCKEQTPLNKIHDYLQYSPIDNIIGISFSGFPDDNGFYTIFVEIEKTKTLFDSFNVLLKELYNLTHHKEWKVGFYKKEPIIIKIKDILLDD